jgi:SAM-dependent methyltransferase
MMEATDAARRAVTANPAWYHTIELAPGVLTPGQVDLRRAAPRVLPDEMGGVRALDVGTFDGFWAFEMERRGAEVVALDSPALDAADWTPHARARLERKATEWDIELGRGFRLAAEILDSRAERIACNVYDLDAQVTGGRFDFAFIGALLIHLRDPVRALERVRGVLADRGEARVMEPFSLRMLLRSPRRPAAIYRGAHTDYTWWLPNPATTAAWMRTAGFASPARLGIVRPKGKLNVLHSVHSARRDLG